MIEGIDSITFSCADTPQAWDEAKLFYSDWGLTALEQTQTLLRWETMNGAEVRIVRDNDPGLPPPIEPGPTVREVVFGVDDDTTLERIAKSLANRSGYYEVSYQNGSVNAATRIGALDPHGLRLGFQRSAKRKLSVKGSPTNPYGDVRRINQPSPVYERAIPVDIGHFVLFTDKLAQAEEFYASIGFVVSDRYPGRGAFMRCGERGGHHDLFLLNLPGKPAGLNHVAFTVRDLHEVFGGGLHMSRCGWKTQLGPGRHPISSAYFWYFENPCGGLIEYNADEDYLTEAWQARDFEPGPTVFAEWAVDGGLDGNTRRQPKVAAGTGFLTEKKP